MNKFKEFLKKIFILKTGVSIAVMLTSFPPVVLSLSDAIPFPDFIDYIIYTYSAYGLIVLIFFFKNDVPRFGRFVKKKISEIPFFGKYLSDAMFMARFAIYQGLAVNTAFAVFKIISSVLYRSVWLASFGAYYLMLGAIQLIIVRSLRKYKDETNYIHELKSYRFCGFLMLVLNGAMVGIIHQIIVQNKGYEYPLFITYVTAIFAFYSFISAVINMIQYRHLHSPIISASKILKFAGALMSMMTLTTAMLSSFGNDADFRKLMTVCVGTGVSSITVIMSVYMIIRSNIRLVKNGGKI